MKVLHCPTPTRPPLLFWLQDITRAAEEHQVEVRACARAASVLPLKAQKQKRLAESQVQGFLGLFLGSLIAAGIVRLQGSGGLRVSI